MEDANTQLSINLDKSVRTHKRRKRKALYFSRQGSAYVRKSKLLKHAAALGKDEDNLVDSYPGIEAHPVTEPLISINIKSEPTELFSNVKSEPLDDYEKELDQLMQEDGPPIQVDCTLPNCTKCIEQQSAYCFLHFHDCLFENKKCIVCVALSSKLVKADYHHDQCTVVSCVFCTETFPDLDIMKAHDCASIADSPYKCCKCVIEIPILSEYYRHILTAHCGVTQIECLQCPATFLDEESKTQHMDDVHPPPPPPPTATIRKESVKERIVQDPSQLPTPRYHGPQRPNVLIERNLTGSRPQRNLPSILRKRRIEPEPRKLEIDMMEDKLPKLIKIKEDLGTGSKLFRFETSTESKPKVNALPINDDDDYSDSSGIDFPVKVESDETGKMRVCNKDTCTTCFDRQAALCMLEFHCCPVPFHENPRPGGAECLVCQQVAHHMELVANDTAIHVGCTIVRCLFCHENFSDMISLRNHSCEAVNEMEIRCRQCGVILPTFSKLCVHLFYHFHINAFNCTHCDKAFVVRAKYDAHLRDHETPTRYSCKFCGLQFQRNREYKNHLYTHGLQKPHKCKICSKSFGASYQLKLHIETHDRVRSFKCNLCTRSFTKARTLQHHEFTFHDSKGYKCDRCNRVLSSPMRLRNHLRSHDQSRAYICKTCGQGYSNKGSLNRHDRVHTDDVLQCDICEYKTFYRFQLRCHMFTHAKEKPFKCSTCPDIGFVTKRSLLKHFDKVHEGDDQNLGPDGQPLMPRRGRPFSFPSMLGRSYPFPLTKPKDFDNSTSQETSSVHTEKDMSGRHSLNDNESEYSNGSGITDFIRNETDRPNSNDSSHSDGFLQIIQEPLTVLTTEHTDGDSEMVSKLNLKKIKPKLTIISKETKIKFPTFGLNLEKSVKDVSDIYKGIQLTSGSKKFENSLKIVPQKVLIKGKDTGISLLRPNLNSVKVRDSSIDGSNDKNTSENDSDGSAGSAGKFVLQTIPKPALIRVIRSSSEYSAGEEKQNNTKRPLYRIKSPSQGSRADIIETLSRDGKTTLLRFKSANDLKSVDSKPAPGPVKLIRIPTNMEKSFVGIEKSFSNPGLTAVAKPNATIKEEFRNKSNITIQNPGQGAASTVRVIKGSPKFKYVAVGSGPGDVKQTLVSSKQSIIRVSKPNILRCVKPKKDDST